MLKFFLLVFLPTVSCQPDFINIQPFVSSWSECYINLIFYQKLNFKSPPFTPIVASTTDYDAYANDKTCIINSTSRRLGSKYTFNYDPHICRYVLKNYMIKGLYCITIVPVLPSTKGMEEGHIYWYLNRYWSRAEMQDYSLSGENKTTYHHGRSYSFPPFFPTEIYIQTILGADSFKSRLKQNRVLGKPIRIWEPYLKLPIITVIVDGNVFGAENFNVSVALSIGADQYFGVYSDTIGNDQGKN